MRQAATDKDQIAQTVYPAQFANRIEDDAFIGTVHFLTGLHFTALGHGDAIFTAFFPYQVRLVNIAGSNNQPGPRMFLRMATKALYTDAVSPLWVLPAIMMG